MSDYFAYSTMEAKVAIESLCSDLGYMMKKHKSTRFRIIDVAVIDRIIALVD